MLGHESFTLVPMLPAPVCARPKLAVVSLALLLCLLLGMAQAGADASYNERRARIGLGFLRTLLGSDQDLAHKADGHGQLPVLLWYQTERVAAERFAAEFFPADPAEPRHRIGSFPVAVLLGDQLPTQAVAAIFLVEPPGSQALDALIAYSRAQKILLFSPFDGHVERGVMAGISIEAKTRPYLNAAALHAAGLHIKPLFLKSARLHE